MAVKYTDHVQGSEIWAMSRCGLITASNASKIMGSGQTRETYLFQLAAERANGPDAMEPSFSNDWMRRGNELEAQARAAFEFANDCQVQEVGLATNSDYPGCGASLDGLIVGHNDAFEAKCPKPGTLQRYHYRDELPRTYRDQVVFQMLICELDHVNFWAWHPAMDPFYIVVSRDEHACKEMAARINDANVLIERYMK